MKKMLGLVLYGSLVFGVSAGGAWYMHSRHQAELAAEKARNQPPEEDELVKSSTHPDVLNPEITELPDEETMRKVPLDYEALSLEEMVQHGFRLKEQAQALRDREDAVLRTEERFELLKKDIQEEQLAVQGLMEQARKHAQAASAALDDAESRERAAEATLEQAAQKEEDTQARIRAAEEAQEKRQKTAQGREQLASVSRSVATAADKATNIKEMAEAIQNMDSDAAAAMLLATVDSGDLTTATRLAAKMERKKFTKVLQSLQTRDPGAAAQLTDAYINMARPPRKKGR